MRWGVLLLVVPVAVARPQTPEFIARARAGTEAFRNPEAARMAGYHPVGPDFPGMGRHWIHNSLILESTPDPARPAILEYAELNGSLTLVGVAYAVLIKSDTVPAFLPVPASAWHFHQGTVTEESFLRSHAGLGHTVPGPRLAVLHAWIWLDNPDGMLATDNWALPYARLGLSPPPNGSRAAARALALSAGEGGRMYLEALVHAVGQPSDTEMAGLAAIIARHQAKARAEAASVSSLEVCWKTLWDELQAAVRPEVGDRLQALR